MALVFVVWFLLFVIVVVLPTVWGLVSLWSHSSARSVRRALVAAGLEDHDDHLRGTVDGVRVYARIGWSGPRCLVQVTGPSLAPGCPEVRATRLTDDVVLEEVRVLSGDERFDERVHVEHVQPHAGLGWLGGEARRAAERAVASGAELVGGRWQVVKPVDLDLDVADLIADIVRASRAFSAVPGRSTRDALEALTRDDKPGVRVRALEALVARDELRSGVVEELATCPFPTVQLAVLRLGGAPARLAGRRLLASGSRSRRARAAVVLGELLAGGMRLAVEERRRVETELVEALAHEEHGDGAAQVLASVGGADLPRRLAERFRGEGPERVERLQQRLIQRFGGGVRGAVSLAGSGGELSLA